MESKSCVVAQTDPTRCNYYRRVESLLNTMLKLGSSKSHENHLLKVVAYPPTYLLSGDNLLSRIIARGRGLRFKRCLSGLCQYSVKCSVVPYCIECTYWRSQNSNSIGRMLLDKGPSRTRGQNSSFMSKTCHHVKNQVRPSATGLFTKGHNLVADGQTSKMPSTTSGAGQIETNFGKQ